MTEALDYLSGQDGFSRPLPALGEQMAARAAAILGGPIASLHDHPVRFPTPLTAESWAAHMAEQQDVLATDELAASVLTLVVANCFSQPELSFIRSWSDSMRRQIAADSRLQLALDATDLDTRDGSLAILLGLEDLGAVSTLDDIEELFDRGIRMAGVAYNTGSLLGCGLAQTDTGLTRFGREAIAVMNERGMLVDVSHAGDRTSHDAIAASTAPVVISHAGAQAIWGSTRMVPDSVIRAAADSGGMIGVEAAPGSTRTDLARGDHRLEDVVRHIEYVAELVGVDAVGLGGDAFYGDHVGLYRALGSAGAALPEGAVAFSGDRVEGAENPSEVPVQVCSALVSRGWADADIAKILGGNVLRVLADTLPTGAHR